MGANSDNWFYRPSEGTSLRTEDLPSRSPLLVLLGSLGMGKTREIKKLSDHLRKPGQVTRLIKASELDSSPSGIVDTPEWKHFKKTGDKLTILIDGIDEVLPYHPNFLNQLRFFLMNHLDSNFSVILGMRSGVWPGNTFDDLFKAWNTTEERSVHELRPLSVVDIEVVFSKQRLTDAAEFIEWVNEKEAASMARIPLYLDEVIKLWRKNPKDRPSVHKLRDTQISQLLRENPDRIPLTEFRSHLNPDQLEALAELIAVHSVLCGRPRFVLGTHGDERNDTLDLISFLSSPMEGQWNINNSIYSFSIRDFLAILERALFRCVATPNAPPAFSFDHHSFAERLAGRCLLRQPLSQIIRMLGNSQGTRIVPQMQPLAALLAPSNAPLAEWLLTNQPKILLGSDATEFDPPQRPKIIERVLQDIESSDENDRLSWTQIDTGFVGSDVAHELISVIEKKDLKSLTRLAAIAIAERCPSIKVAQALWNVLDDSSEEVNIRHEALDAWIAHARLGVPENLEALWKVARGEAGTGKAHDKADALLVLLMSGVAPREIVASIPHDDQNILGGSCYILTHSELPKRLTAEDIFSCLNFLTSRGYASSVGRVNGTLEQATYRLVFENFTSGPIIAAFAEHWWQVSSKFRIRLNGRLQGHIKDLAPSQRQTLITELVMSKERPEQFVWQLPVYPEDFQFLIRKYAISDHEYRAVWLAVISRNWFRATTNGVPDWLSEAYEGLGANFQTAFPRPKLGVTIRERIERSHRAEGLWREFHDRNLQRLVQGEEPLTRSEFVKVVEEQLVSAPINGWINLAATRFYAFSDNDTAVTDEGTEFTKSWPWSLLSEEGKGRAYSSARAFLETQNDRQKNGNWTAWNESAYQAVDLLYHEIGIDNGLGTIVAHKWLYSVIHDFNKDENRHHQLVRLVKTLAPDRVREMMLNEAEAEFQTSNYCMILRKFQTAWDENDGQRLSALMFEKLTNYHSDDELRRAKWFAYAFHFIADNSPQSARGFTSKLISSSNRPSAAYLLLLLFGAVRFSDLWEDIWTRFLSHEEDLLRIALDLFVENLGDYYNQSNWTNGLDSGHLFQLYLLSVQLYPQRESFDFIKHHGTKIYHKRSFEEAIPACLASRGDSAGIEQLMRNTICRDRLNMLSCNLGAARKKADEMGWGTPELKEVSRWILTKDAVFVRSHDDLLAAVMVSLRRFQESLGKDGRAVIDCWERQRGSITHLPSKEEDLSVRIGWHLKSDLKNIIVTRESEIRVGYKNNRTDIEIQAISSGRVLTVIVEHKRAHYDKVTTGLESQLIDRYMVSASCDYGIYLVSWFDGFERAETPIKNCMGVASANEAFEKLSAEAAICSSKSGKTIGVFVLDCVKDANMPDFSQ